MKTRTQRTLATAAGLLAVSALLAGCSGEQSVDAACAQIANDLADLPAELNEAVGEISTDPQAARDLIASTADTMQAEADSLQNPEVVAAVESLADAMNAMAEDMDPLIADPTDADAATALQESATAVQDAGAAIDDLCS